MMCPTWAHSCFTTSTLAHDTWWKVSTCRRVRLRLTSHIHTLHIHSFNFIAFAILLGVFSFPFRDIYYLRLRACYYEVHIMCFNQISSLSSASWYSSKESGAPRQTTYQVNFSSNPTDFFCIPPTHRANTIDISILLAFSDPGSDEWIVCPRYWSQFALCFADEKRHSKPSESHFAARMGGCIVNNWR